MSRGEPFIQDEDFTLSVGDALETLRELPSESVHMCVTSPPYWGLRDYGTGSWEGGDSGCDHKQEAKPRKFTNGRGEGIDDEYAGSNLTSWTTRDATPREKCGKCGARRVDNQLGLEPTPEEYVTRMVEVFREVRRVLRRDGTCWLNIGDSYASNGQRGDTRSGFNERYFGSGAPGKQAATAAEVPANIVPPGLKPKDLCGVPWRLAFALQADGWYLRSDIIWSKPNPMPESVTDRPTKAHEYLFLLSKSPRYFYDADAIRESYTDPREGGEGFRWHSERYTNQTLAQSNHTPTGRGPDGRRKTSVQAGDGSAQHRDGERWPNPGGRNKRTVWEIATEPYPDAHFATFPQALVEPCILAGTSERGCCPVCGAPWDRDMEIAGESGVEREARITKKWQGSAPQLRNPHLQQGVHLGASARRFIGWKPSCECKDHVFAPGRDYGLGINGRVVTPDPVPCTVLDPFLGSGTTALVARRLGRKTIGIELSPEYAELAARRLQQLSLLA